MEQIIAGIFRSEVPSLTLPPYQGTQCYWIGDAHDVVLVDTGDGSPGAQSVLEEDWHHLGRPKVLAVFATHHHDDHSGGGAWAKARWGARLYMNAPDLERLRERRRDPVDSLWQPYASDVFTVGNMGVTLINAPGHTPGQWNFWLPAHRVLLAGDNVLGNTTSVILPPDGDMGLYLGTLASLRNLRPRLLLPGHGDLVADADAYLSRYITHRQERSQEILSALAQGPREPNSIARVIYRDILPPEKMWLGEWMVKGHLDWLSRQQLVVEDNGRFRKVGQS
ncbi:MAG: MBL fold metallo-hydrolase [Thermaerobacter sp.]|nr:MBL fold metallo-hydrolase [Thermaerobacter sp.]